ncbi:hypothetical protein CAPTEDRAFT_166576 [Capitella teleta]|uniref:Uncharacterized protein n=1 Tax=Capitella teleta TaxID=283909 RepID=R7TXW9_CAPTE|nr:hypothetical protein CAPTEDRAFT_166576 [Capitella teleta]|eukprot:ELT96276.1 hypothetical protein CAPTEDRAFT_166576 [Capitella teleta]
MAGLEDKVVIITGASSGIGATTAEYFAKTGAKLVICGRIAENLEKTAERCREAGLPDSKIVQMLGDLTEEDTCKRIVEDAVKHYGRLDVLVNIAGTIRTMCFWNSTPEMMQKHFEWNIMITYHMCKYAMPNLHQTKGNIINIGGLVATRPYNTLFPNSVTKCGVQQMTKCLALEGGPKGVRANCVDPGATLDTALWARSGIAPTHEKWLAHKNKSEPLYPLLRNAYTPEVAKCIVFLASDDARFVTGYCMPIDGGMGLVSQHIV